MPALYHDPLVRRWSGDCSGGGSRRRIKDNDQGKYAAGYVLPSKHWHKLPFADRAETEMSGRRYRLSRIWKKLPGRNWKRWPARCLLPIRLGQRQSAVYRRAVAVLGANGSLIRSARRIRRASPDTRLGTSLQHRANRHPQGCAICTATLCETEWHGT